jgi:SAM-dependent methyltransferase
MSGLAGAVVGIYRDHAAAFDRDRTKSLVERPYLDAVVASVGEGKQVLDLGCGSGEPIAQYFIERGLRVTGVDTSSAMLTMCRDRFPNETWLEGDMRKVELPLVFDAVIAWDSFFHLPPDDQRLMFPRFASWLNPAGVLLFTSGPEEGEAIGEMYGNALYHASLSPEEYWTLLTANRFEVSSHAVNDLKCGGHTVWLAKR